MSSDVVLSGALRNNLLSLQNTQRAIDTTQLRLATGLRVNSALDNPQNFFTAQSLSNRASDFTRLLDGINQSIRTIEEANTGVEALSDLINQAESIAIEAQAEIRASEGFARIRGTEDLADVSDLQSLGGGGIIGATTNQFSVVFTEYDVDNDLYTETTIGITIGAGQTVDNIVAAINADANNNDQLRARVTAGGQLSIESLVENASVRIEGAAASSVNAAGFEALGLGSLVSTENVPGGATQQGGTAIAGNIIRSSQTSAAAVNGVYEASETLTNSGFIDADATTVDVILSIDGQTTNTGTVTGADSIQAVIDNINNAGIEEQVTASFNVDTGQIELELDDGVGTVEIQFTENGGAGSVSFGFGSGEAGRSAGSQVAVNGAAAVAGTPDALAAAESTSEFFVLAGTSADLDQFEEDYNNVRDQIDSLVEDANYRGVNLLSGDNLTTFFNEDRDNLLETDGVDFTALGLGLNEGDFTTSQSIQISIDDSREALSSVRNFGQSIANDLSIIQTRRDFTEETINTLEAGADDLTVADQNEEGANLLALQTRQQLGVTSLSLASQSQQSVLRLF